MWGQREARYDRKVSRPALALDEYDEVEEEMVEGVIEDVRTLPNGYAEIDLRTGTDDIVTILVTPATFNRLFGDGSEPENEDESALN